MRGPFGGELEERGDEVVERAPAAIVEVLRASPSRDVPKASRSDGSSDGLLTFDADDDGAIRYARRLPPALSTSESTKSKALDALARATRVLAKLHADGAAHGDLGMGSEAIRVAEAGSVIVLAPRRQIAPGSLVAAMLRSGAPPAIAGLSSPEALTGHEASQASDVYALAAIAHQIITGRPPLGQIDVTAARSGPFAALASFLPRALAQAPRSRPSAADLAEALALAAASARRAELGEVVTPPPPAIPTRRPASAKEADDRREQASGMSGILMLLLAVGGLFVFTGAIWLVSVTWSALDGPGRFVLLLALTGGVLGATVLLERRGYAGSGLALRVLGLELLWADGAYLLDVMGRASSPGAWSGLALAQTALAFAAAALFDSAVFGALSALHYSVLLVAFAIYIHSGAPTGPAVYPFASGLLASGVAAVGHLLRREKMGVPFALVAALLGFVSAMAGLALLADRGQEAFGAAWPYVVVATSTVLSLLAGRYRGVAELLVGTVLAIAPTTEALVKHADLAYLFAAVAIGFALLVASFVVPRLARDPAAQASWVIVALASVTVAPSILLIANAWDKAGLDIIAGPEAPYLMLVVGTSGALLGVSYAFSKRARHKAVYRLVELAALAQLFGTFTLLSLPRSQEAFYPLAILGLGAISLAVGATTRRATLVLLASGSLLLNLAIQYFQKLWSVFPASLLVLVFGIFLLGGGVLYERRLKHLLPGLRGWA